LPVPIAIYNQDKLVAKTVVNFDSKKRASTLLFQKSPSTVLFPTDNGLAYDNTLYFTISKIKKTNILCIGTPKKSNFLSRIYTDSEFNFVTISSLDYNSIEKQDVIVLNELDGIPQALQTTSRSL
jgi:hypothetical protein